MAQTKLMKVDVWYKQAVTVDGGGRSKLGADTVIMTENQLNQYSGGAFHAVCIRTGKRFIIPEHQIGFIECTPLESEAEKGNDTNA